MRLFGDDTTPEVERLMVEAYRRMTPAQRLAKVASLNASIRAVALAQLREQHPEASERELKLRLFARSADPELFARAFGELPSR